MKRHDEEPRWVVVEGDLRNVSEFKDLPRGRRPYAICPLCEARVVLKLGNRRAHHYAHSADATCSANHPETALHLNTKFHIYHELKAATELKVERRCAVGCKNTSIEVWAQNWESVEVERRMNPIRPDIVLLDRDGAVSLAIEVRASHAVSEEKIALLADRKTPWIEVRASKDFYEGERPWRTGLPMPSKLIVRASTDWSCNECRDARLARLLAAPRPKRPTNSFPALRPIREPLSNVESAALARDGTTIVCDKCGESKANWFVSNSDGTGKCRDCYY